MSNGIMIGQDGHARCGWPGADPLYVAYHDQEWGRPVTDDRRLFEKICLEGFQAGLSWITILRKRENFRAGFAGFDFEKVARFTEKDVQHLLGDTGIIRHRGKIEATINNAQQTCALVDEMGSLANYIWRFGPEGRDSLSQPIPKSGDDIPAMTDASTRLSRDLKRRGFKFVGPTTMYAFMQAMGMVNDHLEVCDMRAIVEQERQSVLKTL